MAHSGIDLSLTDEQRDMQALAHAFAERELRPIAPAVDEADTVPQLDLVRKAAAVGLTSYMLPEAYGGGGIESLVTDCVIVEELSWGDAGLCALITSGGFFADPLIEIGSDEQRARYLSPLCSEDPPLTALATTEPDHGSDAAGMQMRAVRDGDGYRLNGQKTWVSNGGVAQFYAVFAQLEPGSRSKGITAFVVHADDPGVSCGEPMRKLGDRGIVNTELFLDDVHVEADRRIGEEGQGFFGLMRTFDKSRIVLAASAVGLSRAAYEYAAQYAREREQFGKPIIEHQAVGFRLADCAMRIDAARLLAWRAAEAFDRGADVSAQAAMAKLYASECAMFVTWAAVQTLGGWGYSREYPVEKWFRDAKLEEIWEGTSDIQRLIISRHIAKGSI